jgi:hypothetical protein
MTQRYLIAGEWREFSQALGLGTASSRHQHNMKNAFYAGACSCLNAMGRAIEEEDADPSIIDHLEAEIMDFANDMIASKQHHSGSQGTPE